MVTVAAQHGGQRALHPEYLQEMFPSHHEPGACLLIARYGTVEHLECRGLGDVPGKVSISADTNFRLASVTKQFTATAVLILRQRGLLDLENPLGMFVSDFPRYGAETITIRHLLQHTSGLLDYEDHISPADGSYAEGDRPDYSMKNPPLDADVLEIMKKQTTTYFKPGTKFRYSNTGYAVLACIVESLTVSPFAVAMEELIFQPLGMKNTIVMDVRHRPAVPNRAYGYRRLEDGAVVDSDQSITSSVLGDGGIYCSANDYLKWDRALWNGTLLPQEVIAESMTAGVLTPKDTGQAVASVWFPEDMNEDNAPGDAQECNLSGGEKLRSACVIPYGLGWRLEANELGLSVAYHPGSTTGFSHCVRRIPSNGLTILVLANRTVAPSKELAREVEKKVLVRSG